MFTRTQTELILNIFLHSKDRDDFVRHVSNVFPTGPDKDSLEDIYIAFQVMHDWAYKTIEVK